MKRLGLIAAALALCVSVTVGMAVSVARAQAPAGTPTRVRGNVVSLEGDVMTVKTRAGETVKIALAPNFMVVGLVKIGMDQIKPGSFIGTTSVREADGSRKAVEVHVFPEAMRGTGEGDRDWDALPNSKMTNANISAVVEEKSGRVLNLEYKGGSVKVTVPPEAVVVGYEPADKSLIVPGAHVFVVANKAADGSISAARVNVGKNGLVPPM
jgi:hypothetical protein